MTSVHAGRTRPALLPDSAAFWAVGGVLGVFMFAASAPSPLYGVYAARWHFSPLTLTVVFALYAFGLLSALLVTGRLSDHLGRKPVILAAIIAEMIAMACFVLANSAMVLGVARALQGLATGCALGALSAALAELSEGLGPVVSSAAPMLGMAAGALGSSALVQYGPAPLRLVYWLIIAGLVAGAVLVAAMRETGERRPGSLPSLKPVIGVPTEARPAFVTILPSLIALWALIGFYLSLAPGLIGGIERSPNLMWGGLAVFCLCVSGGAAVVLLREISSRSAILAGCVALLAGMGLTLAAIAVGAAALFLAGTVIAGVGFGLAFLGAFRSVVRVTPPARRAGVLAVFYTVSYLTFSVPIVIAGVAETHVSAHDVAMVFSGGVAVLAAIGTAASLRRPARSRPRPAPDLTGPVSQPSPEK